jgi:hypothetical protein
LNQRLLGPGDQPLPVVLQGREDPRDRQGQCRHLRMAYR